MPFGTRTVATRIDINEIFQGNAHNILEKASVSNMIGLLQQMNEISKYASETFGSLLIDAEKNLERIQSCKNRINKLEQNVPVIETMFIQNSPAYFYDNPYSGREYSRRDTLRGLLFRRDRASNEVNHRRNSAEQPPNFSSMDAYSENQVPCIKKYTDSNFFMNQWLEAEKQKMEEDRKRRQLKKETRKKKKQMKRQHTKVIMKVKKKKYDGFGLDTGNEAKTDEQYVEVKQYALDGDVNNIMNTPDGSGADDDLDDDKDHKKSPRISGKDNASGNTGGGGGNKKPPPSNLGSDLRQHVQQASYSPMDSNNKPIPIKVGNQSKSNNDADDEEEDDHKDNNNKEIRNDINFEDDANDDGNNNGRNNNDDEGEIINYRNNPPPPPPGSGVDSPVISAVSNNNNGRSNYNEESDYQDQAIEVRAVLPPQRPKPILPTRGGDFLNAIITGVQLQKAEKIEREPPQDVRSQLLTSISKGKALKHVDKSDAPKPKEEVNASIYAVLQRRKFIEDDESDDSEGSDWGSEED